jgi:4-hydroxybenzoate polyprenyltransferase
VPGKSHPADQFDLLRTARDWLRLVRAPNLLTAPGDPVAGYFLAAGATAQPDERLIGVALASMVFYAAGLVMNDLVDRGVDRDERPDRPLAAGRISAAAARAFIAAWMVCGALLCAAAGVRVFLAGMALIAAIFAYNAAPRPGSLAIALMGACRGLNATIGIMLAGEVSARAGLGAAVIFLYVAAVTLAAQGEMLPARPAWRAWLPAGVLLLSFALFLRQDGISTEMEFRMLGAFFFAFALAGLAGWRLMEGDRGMAPAAIGLLISAMIPFQASLCLASGAGAWGLAAAFILIICWPLNRLLARFFAPS